MSGRGAFLAGGRWNLPGYSVVYSSGTVALAMLELLVHVDDAQAFLRLDHVYHTVRFPYDAIAVLAGPDLPVGWNDRPENGASQLVGSEWLDSQASPVLAVPSVIIPAQQRYELENLNFLINPAHPATADAIEVGPVTRLDLDERLVG